MCKFAYHRNDIGEIFHYSDWVPGEKLGLEGAAGVRLCVFWWGWFREGTDFLECRIGNVQLFQGSYWNALGIFGCGCVRCRGGKRVCFRLRWAGFCAWDTILYFNKDLDLQNFATCPILPHRKHARVSGFLCSFCCFWSSFVCCIRSICCCMAVSLCIIFLWVFRLEDESCEVGLGCMSVACISRGRMVSSRSWLCAAVSWFVLSCRNERKSWNNSNVICSEFLSLRRSSIGSLLFPWAREGEAKGLWSSCSRFVLMLFAFAEERSVWKLDSVSGNFSADCSFSSKSLI